jgi:hypothetical protein
MFLGSGASCLSLTTLPPSVCQLSRQCGIQYFQYILQYMQVICQSRLCTTNFAFSHVAHTTTAAQLQWSQAWPTLTIEGREVSYKLLSPFSGFFQQTFYLFILLSLLGLPSFLSFPLKVKINITQNIPL